MSIIRATFMSGVPHPQASTSGTDANTSQHNQHTGENVVSSTTDVPGPSLAGAGEDVATANGEERNMIEASTTRVETISADNAPSSSNDEMRQRRIERFSSQPDNRQDE